METKPKITTPWGDSQHETRIAVGVTHYVTSEHGGFKLSHFRNKVIKKKLPNFRPFGGECWYEEDLDFALVIMCFPQFFEVEAYQLALTIFNKNGAYFNDTSNSTS